jgi:hypothetical protein
MDSCSQRIKLFKHLARLAAAGAARWGRQYEAQLALEAIHAQMLLVGLLLVGTNFVVHAQTNSPKPAYDYSLSREERISWRKARPHQKSQAKPLCISSNGPVT